MKRLRIFGVALFALATTAFAQTDVTGKISNPSFENDLEGWENDGMSPQGNDAFKEKDGKTYCEKWTGRGNKVGNASIQQTLRGLQAGTYTVTVTAQNIQQDTPNDQQKGVYVTANDNKTEVSVAGEYSVQATISDGVLTLGFLLKGATGNYVCVDHFRLTLEEPTAETYTAIHAQMQKVVDEAQQLSQHLDTPEQQELDAATQALERLIAQNTTEGVTEAVLRLQDALYDYRLSIASESSTLDVTSLLTNPSFEKDGLKGWTTDRWQAQGNSGLSNKNGSTYAETYIATGNKLPNSYISQRFTAPNGKYRMKVAAHHIDQNNTGKVMKGGYVFGEDTEVEVNKTGGYTYTLTFTVIEGQANVGYRTRNATGNWAAVDNFRLTYLGRSEAMLLEALNARIAGAEALAAQQMKASSLEKLNQAIAAAREISGKEGLETAAIALRQAMEEAQTSQEAYALLQTAIDEIEPIYQEGMNGSEEFQAAIQAAKACYANTANTNETVLLQEEALRQALFRFRISNPTGAAPTVTTIEYAPAGATGALGRSTVKGSNIVEKGFCWSTHPQPTVLDNRTTFYYDSNGPIYVMQPLQPATVYYVRAYAMTKGYAVGYGEVRKVITLPKGNCGWWYNYGGDAETNERIANALEDCINYYNNWSATTNFNISVSYSPGTPTADCSYGGSMRVGANASYQRTGTILHESNHGVGVGQQARWWDTNLHDGAWKGYRANKLVQFIDNNPNSTMAGDNMHMWPYGINGAHEDTGNPMLYIANVMITQALHEDGLIPPGHGGCKPAYVFEHEDSIKYYITSEDDAYGAGSAYLTESSTGALSWSVPSGKISQDDAYAWYMTYDPARQLYTLRNAKSGKYFSYSSGIKTVKKATPSTTEYFHLFVGRSERSLGSESFGIKARGYWIMAGNDVENPTTLTAAASGKTSAQAFNIADNASAQRWIILTAQEVEGASSGTTKALKNNLKDLIQNLRLVQQTPYVENANVTLNNDDLLNLLNATEANLETEENSEALTRLYDETLKAGKDYLSSVSAKDIENPFPITFLMLNPTASENSKGWTVTEEPSFSYGSAEYYMKSFNMTQTLDAMPLGNYRLTVQGFQRPGAWNAIYDKFLAGSYTINSSLLMGTKTAKLRHICADGQKEKVGKGSERQVGDLFIPDNMQAAGSYFDKGLYPNELFYTNKSATNKPKDLKVGIKGTNTAEGYWTIFRNFHLYFYGQTDPVGIHEVGMEEVSPKDDIYDLQGRRLNKVRKGLYIRNGKLLLVE